MILTIALSILAALSLASGMFALAAVQLADRYDQEEWE